MAYPVIEGCPTSLQPGTRSGWSMGPPSHMPQRLSPMLHHTGAPSHCCTAESPPHHHCTAYTHAPYHYCTMCPHTGAFLHPITQLTLAGAPPLPLLHHTCHHPLAWTLHITPESPGAPWTTQFHVTPPPPFWQGQPAKAEGKKWDPRDSGCGFSQSNVGGRAAEQEPRGCNLLLCRLTVAQHCNNVFYDTIYCMWYFVSFYNCDSP